MSNETDRIAGAAVRVVTRSKRRRILVVEDEPDILESLAMLLDVLGPLEVRRARDGKEALRILTREAIDLIITDYRMPRMNGIDLLRVSQVIAPGTPALLVTAYPDHALEEAAQLIPGFRALLGKPCDPELLVKEVERALP